MIKILQYLFIIRFRKIVSKDDYLAVFLIVLFYFAEAFLVFTNYESFRNYILLFFLESVVYHLQRSDIEILKLKKNYKVILFIEYFIYSLPFYLVLSFKKEFWLIVVILSFNILLINAPKSNLKTIRYPFNLFTVYWHITFRKYKLIYVFPLFLVLVYASAHYKNDNLLYFVLVALSIIACLPSFEREKKEEILLNPFIPKKYLFYQLKNTAINTFYIVIPIAVTICFFQQWEKLIVIMIVFIPPLLNVILKYLFFNNNFLQQITFTFFIASNFVLFGAPLLVVPFLYKKAIKTLNAIKYADDSY